MGSSFKQVALLSFIYFTPLLAESIDDFSKIRAGNSRQYAIDKWATLLGVAYIAILTALTVLNFEGISLLDYIPASMRGIIVLVLKGIVIAIPSVFVYKKLYDLRISWYQSKNVADAYFDASEKGR